MRFYVQRQVDGFVITTTVVKQAEVMLPQRGTKIYRCLSMIGQQHPLAIMTANVANKTGLNNKETAALLVALMARGLIRRVSERRGMTGGSEWRLATVCETFFYRRTA